MRRPWQPSPSSSPGRRAGRSGHCSVAGSLVRLDVLEPHVRGRPATRQPRQDVDRASRDSACYVAGRLVGRPRDLFREVLAAAGAAIVLHSLIGLLQLYSFSKDQFPLLFLYVNPSFSWTQEEAERYARYNKRPAGLFREAAAMAAALGPWVVLLAGLLLNPGLRRRLGWRRAWPVLPPVACGCLLLALSQSGSTVALMAALLVICAGEVWRMVHAPLRPSQLVMVALVLLSVASVLGYAITQLGSPGNLEGRIDCSWGLRVAAIRMGLTLNSDPLNVAVGVGPGQAFEIIASHWSGPSVPEIRARGGDLELGRHLLRGDGIAGRCGDAGRASDGGGGHRTLLGRPARPVRAGLVDPRRGRDVVLFPPVAYLAVPRRGALLGSVVPRTASMRGR